MTIVRVSGSNTCKMTQCSPESVKKEQLLVVLNAITSNSWAAKCNCLIRGAKPLARRPQEMQTNGITNPATGFKSKTQVT